jgi:predicted peptidase
MMRKNICLFFFLLYSIAGSAQHSEYLKNIFTDQSGHALPYRLLPPVHIEPNASYPLIIFLHGSGERGDENERQLIHGGKLFADSLRRINYPAYVLFPQCPKEMAWSSVNIDTSRYPLILSYDYLSAPEWPMTATNELIEYLSNNYRIDKSRIYLSGLSLGGMAVFEFVYRYPNLFAAALPICGGGNEKQYDKRVRSVPFRIYHGDADKAVDVEESRQMVNRLKQLRCKVEYIEYPGVGHNSWNNAFADPEFLKWMFQQKRTKSK